MRMIFGDETIFSIYGSHKICHRKKQTKTANKREKESIKRRINNKVVEPTMECLIISPFTVSQTSATENGDESTMTAN